MKTLYWVGGAMLLVTLNSWAQNKAQPGQSSTPTSTEPSAQSPQAEPPSATQPNLPPAASSSKTISGTVESLSEGKSMKVRTAEGKTKTFNLRDAAVDASVKVGSAVRVTQSRDVNGKSALTVEPDSAEKTEKPEKN